MEKKKYDIFEVMYSTFEDGSSKRFEEYLTTKELTENDVIISLIEDNYLQPQDICFVDMIPTKTGYNIINKENMLIFRFQYV